MVFPTWVLAFLSPPGLFLSVAGSKKFMARQLGPFEIIERVGRPAYKLRIIKSPHEYMCGKSIGTSQGTTGSSTKDAQQQA